MAERPDAVRALLAHPVAAACTAAIALVIVRLLGGEEHWAAGTVVALALSYACGAYAGRPDGFLGVAALAAALQIAAGGESFPNVEIAFMTLGPWWAGHEVQSRRRLVEALARRTAQLETEQQAYVELSVRRERARVARELHDIVAHHLAVIVVQAGAGRMAPAGDDAQAAERLRVVRQAGGEALAEMARLLDLIHSERRGGPDRLATLVEQVCAGGLEVDVRLVPPDAAVALGDDALQVVREGLTNAMKHAPGAHVQLRVELDGEWLEIEVRDSGATGRSPLAGVGSGLGLAGMRERVEARGGTLAAAPDGAGWRLHARLPVGVPPELSPRGGSESSPAGATTGVAGAG